VVSPVAQLQRGGVCRAELRGDDLLAPGLAYQNVSSQNVGANPCGRPVGQARGLPLPRIIEKIPFELQLYGYASSPALMAPSIVPSTC
jgi:hypothetical protein